jgi:hypothetical protein
MITLRPARTRTPKVAPDSRESSRPQVVSAERVKEMLREIAFVLHATRVVRRMDEQGVVAVDAGNDGCKATSHRQTSTR